MAPRKTGTKTQGRRHCDDERQVALLTTLGATPSVLTSTVWALAHRERVVPHRIRALTTRLGARLIQEQLFSPHPDFGGKTVWQSLRESLRADGFDIEGRLAFGPTGDCVRTFTAIPPNGGAPVELDDIRSQPENEQVADSMLETIRGAMDDDTRLIASIAGGRKTMSALFYACMSLIGRGDDRIIHVVVNEPFERGDLTPPFFYPSQPKGKLATRNGLSLRAGDARPDIVDVPFVPLRNLLPKELGRVPGRFSTLVTQYRDTVAQHEAAANLRVKVHYAEPKIEVDGTPAALGPREHLLMIFFAEGAVRGTGNMAATQKELEAPINECLRRVSGAHDRGNMGDWRYGLVGQTLSDDDIRRSLSRLAANLKSLGSAGVALASVLPKRGRLRLDLSPEQIQLLD